MISVSKKFRDAKRRDFYVTAQCTLSDGTVLDLKREDFYISGNGIVDSSDSTDFPLGCAIEKTATLSLVNDDDRFSEYNFNAARFVLTLNLDFDDGTSEKIRKGTFIVLKKPATAGKINMTLADRMYYADRTYTTKLIFPTTAGEVLRDCCQTCGIQLGDASFVNDDFVISEAPSNTTHRAVIGYIAMLAGGNARVDENDRLRIVQFSKDVFANNYDGGTFRPWTDGDDLDGGTFNPWTTGTVIDGGTFAQMEDYLLLYKIKGLQVDTDDVVVTGVKATADDVEYSYGEEGYVVKIENPLIAGREQEAVDLIGKQIVGMTMRPFSCEHVADPTATFLDPVYVVDVKQNVYQSYLTNVEFLFNGTTKFSNTAKSAEEEEIEYYSGNSAIVEQAKKEAGKMLDQYDVAVRNMNELAANLFGYYSTTVVSEDGSRVDYWHDKPNLSESKTVYKKGIDGFFVTQEYQGTDEATSLAGKWKAGFDSNGNATLNILYAIGIVAEWINTRGLTARDNDDNITFRIDPATGAVDIVAKSFSLSSGKTIESIAESAANEKTKTFLSTPVPPYHKGDLWYGGTSADVKVCVTSRETGSYNSADWQKQDRYIDQSTAETAGTNAANAAIQNMTQTDVLNKLTNGGVDKGIYLQNGNLYISFSAARGGELTLGGANNGYGKLRMLDSRDNEIGTWGYKGIELVSSSVAGQDGNVTCTGASNKLVITRGGVTLYDAKTGKEKGGLNTSTSTNSNEMALSVPSGNAVLIGNVIKAGYLADEASWVREAGSASNSGTYFPSSDPNVFEGKVHSRTFIGRYFKYNNSTGANITLYSSNVDINPGSTLATVNITQGNFTVGGKGYKSKVMDTDAYGDRLLFCYEMATPLFGDIGQGVTDENGNCYVYLDDMFSQTIITDCEYQAFLQKEGPGDIWVEKKEKTYFLVKGTPNLPFAWEVKARQKYATMDRLESFDEVNSTVYDDSASINNYETDYTVAYASAIQERSYANEKIE